MKSSIIILLTLALVQKADSVFVLLGLALLAIGTSTISTVVFTTTNEILKAQHIETHANALWVWADQLGKQPNVDWVLCCEYWQCAFHNMYLDEGLILDIDASGRQISPINTADITSVVNHFGQEQHRAFKCYTGIHQAHLCMTAHGDEDLGDDQMRAHGWNVWQDGKGKKCF